MRVVLLCNHVQRWRLSDDAARACAAWSSARTAYISSVCQTQGARRMASLPHMKAVSCTIWSCGFCITPTCRGEAMAHQTVLLPSIECPDSMHNTRSIGVQHAGVPSSTGSRLQQRWIRSYHMSCVRSRLRCLRLSKCWRWRRTHSSPERCRRWPASHRRSG